MPFKEKIKDLGREIIGQGPEVKFKNEVLQHEKNMGLTHEEAEKEIFNNYLGTVRAEVNHKGMIDYNSKNWRNFEAGLNEAFGRNKTMDFIEDANNPALFRRAHVTPITSRESAQVEDYYKDKFDGEKPPKPIIDDCVQRSKEFRSLSRRFESRTNTNPDSLKDLVTNYPELSADLGMMLLVKHGLERHEKVFSKQERSRKYNEDLKKEFKDAFSRSQLEIAGDFFGDLKRIKLKSLFSLPGSFEECAKFVFSATKALGKEGIIGTKLAYKLTKSCYALLSEKLVK